MEKEEIIKYIENPHELNEYSFSELRALLRKYPYFQTAHQLLLLNLKNINDPRFKEFLKQSAVYIKSREKFYRLINDLSEPEGSVQSEADSSERSAIKEASEEEAPAGEKSKSAVKSEDQSESKEANNKKEKTKKDKDYSTAYLKQRISDTLSVQRGDGAKEEDIPDDSSDFFILDKASQVEEKMSRKLKEKYEKESREEKEDGTDKPSGSETESFELDSGEREERRKSQGSRNDRNVSGEYFTEQDYRKTVHNKEQNDDLIDRFLKDSPGLKTVNPPDNKEEKEDISSRSVTENEEMLSEKLINIYIKQGYYNKAIAAYKKLSLKYPEKSDYFAEQIEKLKNIINEQQK